MTEAQLRDITLDAVEKFADAQDPGKDIDSHEMIRAVVAMFIQGYQFAKLEKLN